MLKQLLKAKAAYISTLREKSSSKTFIEQGQKWQKQSLYQALKQPELSLIAEVKKGSPSNGIMRQIFDAAEIAKSYQHLNPAAFSVLTDEAFFYGAANHLTNVKNVVKQPVLRKDFIQDPIQVYESFALGADAILLIAEILEAEQAKQLYDLAYFLGMDVLFEIHDNDQLFKLLPINPKIIGINNRNLETLTVDVTHCEKLFPIVRQAFPLAVLIAESGIKTKKQLTTIEKAGFDAVLIGEGLINTELSLPHVD